MLGVPRKTKCNSMGNCHWKTHREDKSKSPWLNITYELAAKREHITDLVGFYYENLK